jgi:hypothetical protein
MLALLILAVLLPAFGAQARLFGGASRMIIANPCVMSYTDALGKQLRVVRTNPLIIMIK